jgi:hypothetical protein
LVAFRERKEELLDELIKATWFKLKQCLVDLRHCALMSCCNSLKHSTSPFSDRKLLHFNPDWIHLVSLISGSYYFRCKKKLMSWSVWTNQLISQLARLIVQGFHFALLMYWLLHVQVCIMKFVWQALHC